MPGGFYYLEPIARQVARLGGSIFLEWIVFLFFSNKIGCLGSILISVLITALLLWALGWL